MNSTIPTQKIRAIRQAIHDRGTSPLSRVLDFDFGVLSPFRYAAKLRDQKAPTGRKSRKPKLDEIMPWPAEYFTQGLRRVTPLGDPGRAKPIIRSKRKEMD